MMHLIDESIDIIPTKFGTFHIQLLSMKKENAVKIKQQILDNQEIVSRLKSRLDTVSKHFDSLNIKLACRNYKDSEYGEIAQVMQDLRREHKQLEEILGSQDNGTGGTE